MSEPMIVQIDDTEHIATPEEQAQIELIRADQPPAP